MNTIEAKMLANMARDLESPVQDEEEEYTLDNEDEPYEQPRKDRDPEPTLVVENKVEKKIVKEFFFGNLLRKIKRKEGMKADVAELETPVTEPGHNDWQPTMNAAVEDRCRQERRRSSITEASINYYPPPRPQQLPPPVPVHPTGYRQPYQDYPGGYRRQMHPAAAQRLAEQQSLYFQGGPESEDGQSEIEEQHEDHGAREENILKVEGRGAMGLKNFDVDEPGLTEGQRKVRIMANEAMARAD